MTSRPSDLCRRDFLKVAGLAAIAAAAPSARAATPLVTRSHVEPESLVKLLHESLSREQKRRVCFPWDHVDAKRGLLRTYVSANWNITDPEINSDFYRPDQRALVRAIFDAMIEESWKERFDRQLEDDAGGFGEHQSLAIFGSPEQGPFEFVLTGRHTTLRCDGNSAEHVAFGGPIFYGHATGTWWSGGFIEKADHPGNVFWPQALEANKLYTMLDGRQRDLALVRELPKESAVGFKGSDEPRPGIPVTEFSVDQRGEAQRILQRLIDPFRKSDRDEAVSALDAQGGLDACSLAFYAERDLGSDGVWDCFRLEGPSFVWYFRGAPHVHVWVNVASEATVKLNSEPL